MSASVPIADAAVGRTFRCKSQRRWLEERWDMSRWFGRSTWRYVETRFNHVDALLHELDVVGTDWAPLRAALFGETFRRAQEAIVDYNEVFLRLARDRS